MRLDVVAVAQALTAAQNAGLPIQSIDFDANGAFRIVCGLTVEDWAGLELMKLCDGGYAFPNVAVAAAVQNLLRDRLIRRAEEFQGGPILVSLG